MVDAPVCTCGGAYESRGCELGGPVFSLMNVCPTCGEKFWVLGSGAGTIGICIPKGVDAKPVENWFNTVMAPTWRHHVACLDAFKTRERKDWLEKCFYREFPELKGRTDGNGYVLFDDVSISYHECPNAAKRLYDEYFGDPQGRPKFGRWLQIPPELVVSPIPPQFPANTGTTLWTLPPDSEEWDEVTPEESAKYTPPRDPILVQNEEFFAAVWSRIEALGFVLPERSEVANGYGGIEPWYTFTIGDAQFILGWRKRVISVEVEASTPISTWHISRLAKKDQVTYEAQMPTVRVRPEDFPGATKAEKAMLAEYCVGDDGLVDYHPCGYPKATRVVVHAWGQDKLVEYLAVLLRAVACADK